MSSFLRCFLCSIFIVGARSALLKGGSTPYSRRPQSNAEESVDPMTSMCVRQTLKTRQSLQVIRDESEVECDNMCSDEPKEGDDPLLDQREALFSTLGTLWSAGIIPTSAIFSMYSTKN